MIIPACHNRPEIIGYTHQSGEFIPHRMSQSCKSWSTGDPLLRCPCSKAGNAQGADGFRALTFCGLRRSRRIWNLLPN